MEVSGQQSAPSSIFIGAWFGPKAVWLLHPEDEGFMILWNITKCSPDGWASHSRRIESSL